MRKILFSIQGPFKIVHIPTSQFKHIMKTHLKYPIIVTSNKNDKINAILDGHHRVKKAEILNKKTLKAYIIPEADLKALSAEDLKKLI